MPEEWFEIVSLFWSRQIILNGRLANGKIVEQKLTPSQVGELNSLQSAHDIEMQRLLRSFVNE